MTSFDHPESIRRGLQLDRVNRRVYINGRPIPKPLSQRAFRLLEFLSLHANRVCSREEISKAVYGDAYCPDRDDARLDALIERTRKQLGDDQRQSRFLKTVRGIGHRLLVPGLPDDVSIRNRFF